MSNCDGVKPPPRPPTNAQIEPPFLQHATLLFSFRYPDVVAHWSTRRCAIEEPHLVTVCGEFDAVRTQMTVPAKGGSGQNE